MLRKKPQSRPGQMRDPRTTTLYSLRTENSAVKMGRGSKNKPGTIVNPSLPTSARLETSGGYRVCRVRIWIALPCMIVQPGNSPMATVSCLDVRRTYSVPYCAVGIIAFCLFVHGRISCAESEFVGDSVPKALLIPTLRGKVTELVSPAFLA